MKRENMRYLLFIIILAAVIITAGCANYVPALSYDPGLTEAHFGTPYANANQEVIVYSVQKNRTFTSFFYNVSSTKEAASGKIFVIIDAQITNIGAERITVFPHDFSIGDSDGNRYEKEPIHGDDWLRAGDLNIHQYKKGKVLFEVPQNAKNLVLFYTLNGKLLSWKIN